MRSLTVTCTHGHPIVVDRALAWTCPSCGAIPWVACRDLRGESDRVRTRPHLERTALRMEADELARSVNA